MVRMQGSPFPLTTDKKENVYCFQVTPPSFGTESEVHIFITHFYEQSKKQE